MRSCFFIIQRVDYYEFVTICGERFVKCLIRYYDGEGFSAVRSQAKFFSSLSQAQIYCRDFRVQDITHYYEIVVY